MIALEWLHECCMGYVWGGSRGTKPCVFRLKWLQPAMKGTSSVRRVRLGSFHARIVPPMRFPSSGCSCVRSSMRFLKLWLQIALEWLHECCMGFLGQEAAARHLVFSRVKSLQPAKKGTSSVLRLGSFTCSSYVFCNEWLFLSA